MEKQQIRERLADLAPGSRVHIKLADGRDVSGEFTGIDGDTVHVEGADDVEVAKVENVLMDVSSGGVE